MNRIILIGNGFDLAHGLKTSYKDFINWFREDLATQILSDIETTIFENDYVIVEKPYTYQKYSKVGNTNYQNLLYNCDIEKMTIKYKNQFLQIIIKEALFQNWVDIEEEYFKELKKIINNHDSKYTIKQLNNDFEKIGGELENYLYDKCNNGVTINENLKTKIYSNFHKIDFSNKGVEGLIEDVYQDYLFKYKCGDIPFEDYDEYYREEPIQKDRQYFVENIKNDKIDLMPLQNVLFLNFNYTTRSTEPYINAILFEKEIFWEEIHIHGKLKPSNSPMIFGYGDEQDEIHKELEKQGGDYLENIKTINYTKTPNYKNLLNFIESGMYQVFIMGHSCGLSDKTLLNTLFEHENCVSIKPFYYIDENGHNNYDDIVKNIYRCFTNKTLMREKVVNLKYCEELSKNKNILKNNF